MKPSIVLSLSVLSLSAVPCLAIDPPVAIKEAAGEPVAGTPTGCPLEPNLTGTCANLSYYNLCSGYLWVYSNFLPGEGAGVSFTGDCIAPTSRIDRVITYWRDVAPGYGYTVDIFVDADTGQDGCPDYNIATHLDLDPALRWNCSEIQTCVPADAQGIIVRAESDGGVGPSWATDGPHTEFCDPKGSDHSFYYGFGGSVCVPWRGPTGRGDNFLFWLILSQGCNTPTAATTWGQVKGLFR